MRKSRDFHPSADADGSEPNGDAHITRQVPRQFGPYLILIPPLPILLYDLSLTFATVSGLRK
ncbi:MAG: hypothetical protein QOJ64_1464 [Acidobacteriota bacterium]|nr:hypothetical protein [Acidobacteriota bacterium]